MPRQYELKNVVFSELDKLTDEANETFDKIQSMKREIEKFEKQLDGYERAIDQAQKTFDGIRFSKHSVNEKGSFLDIQLRYSFSYEISND